MYRVDERDLVVPLSGAPQSSVGAPLPLVLQVEDRCLLAFYVQVPNPGWDVTSTRIVYPDSAEEPVAIVQFELPRATYLGAPNDEAFEGHPLASRGLRPYAAYEVRDSSWVRTLERMNSVHPSHSPAPFRSLRHYVFAFHDSTFECVARGVSWSVHPGPLLGLVPLMQTRLGSYAIS